MEEAYLRVKETIAQAARRAGHQPQEIALSAVSKYATMQQVEQLHQLGQQAFAENRADKLLEKNEQLSFQPIWHFIGQLQTNKVKYIIDKVSLIHSVDRLSLAKEIDKRAAQHHLHMDVLLQVRFDENPKRGGVAPQELEALLCACGALSSIAVRGLMCVAPLHADRAQTERCFDALYELSQQLKGRCPQNASMEHLSMGMSNDYPLAIEHGATMVRVGSALFGKHDQ